MVKKGFQDTTIRDICEKANVSVGTFYSYFKSKNDVLKELYLSADKFFYKFVASEIENQEFSEKLKIFVFYYAKLNSETGLDMLRVLYSPINEWFAQTRPYAGRAFAYYIRKDKNMRGGQNRSFGKKNYRIYFYPLCAAYAMIGV